MKVPGTWRLLLMVGVYGVYGVPARGISTNSSIIPTGISAAEALHTTNVNSSGGNGTLTPQKNYDGWVNPEDLTPMPQCIAQQDQSAWLSAMTKCTSKRCTSWFIFCTHSQWLTQLSCLSTGFSPDIVRGYLPYCGRSVLAKAQLYRWVREITGRTWLVDVGDANGLDNLSPASLAQGYATLDVTYKAPTCLTRSVSSPSAEPFQRAMASCSFTSTTQHTGNAARPWEYNGRLRSMTALDSETVGYDLVWGSIEYGHYFDRECFCTAFTIDPKKEPCSGPGQILDLTKERLWINATCGPTSLPDNWTDALKTTEFACIPVEDWQWPRCVADMPKQVIELPDRCTTDACEIGPSGYCKVRRAVDRACFCRDISYDSCRGSCQLFETRIDYIKWLHDICGDVQDWHGLPDNWRQLAAPTRLDLIPWRWTVKASDDSNTAYTTSSVSTGATEACVTNEWKLGSLALVNLATFLAAFFCQRTGRRKSPQRHAHPWRWIFDGTWMIALQILANWVNIFLIQSSPGYQDVPAVQLMLLWGSMPRPTWLIILLIGMQPFESMNLPAVTSFLFAETTLQFLSSYYMVTTVNYGREHHLYLGRLERAEGGGSAKLMYAGALMWLVVSSLVILRTMWASRRINKPIGSGSLDVPKWRRGPRVSLLTNSRGGRVVYGTFPVITQDELASQKAFMERYATTIISLLLLWFAQWLFWGGFIGLSSEAYCPPNFELLTAVWTAFSMAGTTV
ncbi:putative protein bli-3 [Rosellinia necatrix]|uniref:Uncharacterized protein n=1 Tax=Rosellinia necatrix TaxID=77044 RepID=A0A1W2TAT8_ROSNE|nr:putative protein bli-3 [Rosellinia necatrix]